MTLRPNTKKTSGFVFAALCGVAMLGAAPRLNVTPATCAMQGVNLLGVPWSVEVLENGLEDYLFDLNNDGFSDIELLVPQGDTNRIPVLYWVNDEQGRARYTLQDSLRDGTCRQMSVMWQQYQPDWKKGA